MRVIGAAEVEAAGPVLRLAPGELLTPLGWERARELGIQVEVAHVPSSLPARSGSPEPAHVVSPPRAVRATQATGASANLHLPSHLPPSAALYRRGLALAEAQPVRIGGRGGKALVVGAGHVGATTAMRIAETDLFTEVALCDVVPGLAEGIALDLQHEAGVCGFRTRLIGSVEPAIGDGADLVVITAGQARQPGMSRADLLQANAAIVRQVAKEIAIHAPGAVVVVVTNPLDEMTELTYRITGFPATRVLGMAGVLDAARFIALASLAGAGPPGDITALALGSHGEEMVIPLSQAKVRGRPLTEVLDAATLEALVTRTRDAGAEVVRLLRHGSAYFAPAAAVCQMVAAIRSDSRQVMPACVRAEGHYGIHGVYVGLPAKLGATGVEEIIELPLSDSELAALRAAAARIAERVRALG